MTASKYSVTCKWIKDRSIPYLASNTRNGGTACDHVTLKDLDCFALEPGVKFRLSLINT